MLIPWIAFGQTEGRPRKNINSIAITFGIIHSRLIDQGYTASRLKFHGTNAKFGLVYGTSSEKSIFHFSLLGSGGTLTSTNGSLPSDFYTTHAFAEYLRKEHEHKLFGKKGELFVGIRAGTMNYFLQNDPVIDNLDVLSLHGVYLDFLERLKLTDNQRLQFTLLIPVMVYTNQVLWNGGASRYTVWDRDHVLSLLTGHGHTHFLAVTKNVQLRADYVARLGDKTDFLVSYGFVYLNNSEQAPFRMYSNELVAGLKFKF